MPLPRTGDSRLPLDLPGQPFVEADLRLPAQVARQLAVSAKVRRWSPGRAGSRVHHPPAGRSSISSLRITSQTLAVSPPPTL